MDAAGVDAHAAVGLQGGEGVDQRGIAQATADLARRARIIRKPMLTRPDVQARVPWFFALSLAPRD